MGAALVITAGCGGPGLIITLITASGTFAAVSAFSPSTLVSKPSKVGFAAFVARILAMMTSSERPVFTMLMTSSLARRRWMVVLSWARITNTWLNALKTMNHVPVLIVISQRWGYTD